MVTKTRLPFSVIVPVYNVEKYLHQCVFILVDSFILVFMQPCGTIFVEDFFSVVVKSLSINLISYDKLLLISQFNQRQRRLKMLKWAQNKSCFSNCYIVKVRNH